MPKAAEVKEQLTDLDYANLYRALMAIAKENDVSVRFEEMEIISTDIILSQKIKLFCVVMR